MSKIKIEIQKALNWAYLDELSKKYTSAAEGNWIAIAEYGQRGGIDVGQSAAQRYAHHGLPDPDALKLEAAVNALPDVMLDWAKELPILGPELSGLVTVNDFSRRSAVEPKKATKVGWTDVTGKWRTATTQPRDVLMLGAIRTSALVTMHARRGSTPDWREDEPRPYQVRADKGPNAKVIGNCEGKNRYSLGAYCPLQWEPRPVSVLQARADYLVWWRALGTLAATVKLDRMALQFPAAANAPWLTDGSTERASDKSRSAVKQAVTKAQPNVAPNREHELRKTAQLNL